MDDKRRKLDDPYALDGSDEDSYKPYVPVKKRREAQFAQLESRHSMGSAALDRKRKQEEADAEEVEGKLAREGPKGNAITLLIEAQEVKRLKAIRGTIRYSFNFIDLPETRSRAQMRRRLMRTRSLRRRQSYWQLNRRDRRNWQERKSWPKESFIVND